ncbi:MAG: YdcF family protein [Hyphomicrobiaceae bacterium]|nr:YdcF family protein [Hyphomicrobiaceae bacterium]
MAASIRLIQLVIAGVAIAGVLVVAGFVLFANAIERDTGVPQAAHGIVALTGGKDRIGEAVRLLADGQAKRLLITGVNPTTKARDLEVVVPRGTEFFACCVDLDHAALDTIGNAAETKAWAAKHGFNSLIVVTSAYHMPRTLVEFAREMPDVHLVPHPVVSRNFHIKDWWSHPGTTRILISEYLKYLGALARFAGARIGVNADLAGSARSSSKRD